MGIWWKKTDHFPDDSGVDITISRDIKAWPKNKAPILWRWQHRWMLFRVNTTTPYHLFFSDGERSMEYRRLIKEKQFAARVGDKDLRLVAIEQGTEIPLEIVQADWRRWTREEILIIKEGDPEDRIAGYPWFGEFILV